jgi:hypothetical protein
VRRTHFSLDDTTPDGQPLHAFVADPYSDYGADDDAIAPDGDGDPTSGGAALLDAVARARELDRRATATESEARDQRRRTAAIEADARDQRQQAARERAKVIALANSLTQAIAAEDLLNLSPQQLGIVRARIELVGEREEVTHHAVARRLGLHPAAVSKQWRRVLAKLATHESRTVSTSSAFAA